MCSAGAIGGSSLAAPPRRRAEATNTDAWRSDTSSTCPHMRPKTDHAVSKRVASCCRWLKCCTCPSAPRGSPIVTELHRALFCAERREEHNQQRGHVPTVPPLAYLLLTVMLLTTLPLVGLPCCLQPSPWLVGLLFQLFTDQSKQENPDPPIFLFTLICKRLKKLTKGGMHPNSRRQLQSGQFLRTQVFGPMIWWRL